MYDSLWLAEELGITHNRVLEKIRKMDIDLFEERHYINSRNREYKKYNFDFEGLVYFMFVFEFKNTGSTRNLKKVRKDIIKEGLIDEEKIVDIIKKAKFKEKPEEAKTYLMYCEGRNLYKIGRSVNVMKRLKSMETAIPNIKLICYCNQDIELILHKKLKKLRREGEWFELSGSVLDRLKIIYAKEYTLLGFTSFKNSINGITSENSKSDLQLKQFKKLYSGVESEKEIEKYKEFMINEVLKTL